MAVIFDVHPKSGHQINDDWRSQREEAGVDERQSNTFHRNTHPLSQLTTHAKQRFFQCVLDELHVDSNIVVNKELQKKFVTDGCNSLSNNALQLPSVVSWMCNEPRFWTLQLVARPCLLDSVLMRLARPNARVCFPLGEYK